MAVTKRRVDGSHTVWVWDARIDGKPAEVILRHNYALEHDQAIAFRIAEAWSEWEPGLLARNGGASFLTIKRLR